jgi:hypothetical protein
MKKILLVFLLAFFIASPAFAATHVTATDIQKINLGDSVEHVVEILGNSYEVVSQELTESGEGSVGLQVNPTNKCSRIK